MGLDAILLLVLLLAALASFGFEVLPVEVTGMCLLAALLLTGLVPLEEAVAGLSNPGVVTIGGLFVLSHALTKTGFLEIVADRLSGRFGRRPWLGVAAFLVLVALMSGFLNNTAVVAMTIPLAMDLCRRFRLSPSRVLIPLSFATIFGGTLTLIGTSTNLLVSSLGRQAGLESFGMFELTPVGIVFLLAGLAYVLLLGPRLLPERAGTESLTGKYEMAEYLTELRIVAGSKLVGTTVRALDLSKRYDVTVLAVLRGRERLDERLRALRLVVGDVLVVRGAMPNLLRLRNELGAALLTDVKLTDAELAGGEQVVVEALIPPASALIGRTLRELDFRSRYRAFVLAVRRHEETLHDRLADTPLRFSDTLLVVTSRERLEELRRNEDVVVTSELDLRLRRQRFWWLPLALVPAVMTLAAFGVLDILAGVLVACVLLLALGVLTPREAYRSVDWSVVLFIAAFIPVGGAMFRTGLADALAEVVLAPGGWVSAALAPWIALSVLYLATSLITETITNNAAAIVLTPVAIAMAGDLGVEARPFVFAVCFAASASFMTPTGYQTNMMVYGPGSYRFVDYLKFGTPLNLLFWVLASFLIPWFWPFG
ncbi:MAG: SLC13 family permease [Thermoanaerobaculia bacterium]